MLEPTVHASSLALHIGGGLLTAAMSLQQLLLRHKGDAAHARRGRRVLRLATLTVLVAVLGTLLYRPRPDLLTISLLVGYQIYSGVRCLRLANNGRRIADWLPASLLLLSAASLLTLNGSQRMQWEPARVYGTAGAALIIGSYDLLRMSFPLAWRRFLNPAEHAWRLSSMTGAFASVASAQLLPTAAAAYVSLTVSALFGVLALSLAWQAARKALGEQPSAALKARLKAESEL
ncbi:hypothetical protein LNV23_02065 [Paucibacter sp. DJ1R-11]|nr:hypothetical protein [Paucibacter sp. DJ1R-11]MCV2362232.1 hypothetical protein [Paucibacter sp. DJ1R-11]